MWLIKKDIMKTKIFTLVSVFSFAILSAECSEKMINGVVIQANSGSIKYSYNDEGDPVAYIGKDICICKTPVMERRQGLPKTPNTPSVLQVENYEDSGDGEINNLPTPPLFCANESIDSGKALDVRVLGPSDFITPVKKRTKKVPPYQRPLFVLSANVACVRHQNLSFSDQISLQNGLFTPTKRFKRAVSYPVGDEERAKFCRRLFQ